MEPIPFKQQNVNLERGDNPDSVLELPVYRDSEQVISCWRLTIPEIEMIAKTGVLWVHVMGRTTPPLLVSANSPFPDA